MRIAMVTIAFPGRPDQIVGGIEAAVVCLVRGLMASRAGLDIHVIRTVGAGESSAGANDFPWCTVHDVPVRRRVVALPGLGPARRIHRLLDALKPEVVGRNTLAVHERVIADWRSRRPAT